MLRQLRRVIKWLAEHIYVRNVDLQGKRDDMAHDEVKPKNATEIGVKFRW